MRQHSFPFNLQFHMFRPYFLISSQLNLYERQKRILQEIAENNNFLILQKCTEHSKSYASDSKTKPKDIRCSYSDSKLEHEYPSILNQGTFCLIARTTRLVQVNLLESLAASCIPVIMADNVVMPFSEVPIKLLIVFFGLFNFIFLLYI